MFAGGTSTAAAPSFAFGATAPQSTPAPAPAGAPLSSQPAVPQISSSAPVGNSQKVGGDGSAAVVSKASTATADSGFIARLNKAWGEGAIPDALNTEIKTLFSYPMSTASTSKQTAATSAQAAGAMAVASQAAARLGGVNGVSALQSETSKRDEVMNCERQRGLELLSLLQLCDSGYNNSELNANSPEDSDLTRGLHSAAGSVSATACADLIQYIQKAVAPQMQSPTGPIASLQSMSPLSDWLREYRKRDGPNAAHDPLLLAAQCLYLFSRHFQMNSATFKDALSMLEDLLTSVQIELSGRSTTLSRFRTDTETRALNALTWLCVFSVVNMAASWKKVRAGGSGDLQGNSLLLLETATLLEQKVDAIRKKLCASPTKDSTAAGQEHGQGDRAYGAYSGGLLSGGGLMGYKESSKAAPASSQGIAGPRRRLENEHAMRVIESYLSILTLAEGCLLRAKGSDKGYDKALEAFLGDRMPGVGGTRRPCKQGKAVKRMVELAPAPEVLAIQSELIYLAPYEILSYLFDDMLPLLRYVSELEVASQARYVEQLEELPILRGRPATFAQSRHGAEKDGDYHGLYGMAGPDDYLNRPYGQEAASGDVCTPFTSEMSHIADALNTCLEHLPPQVLNPDLDSDCAATFFIFKNCVKHMRQMFKTQRGTWTIWENYSLKLTSCFLDVLTMIGRHPQYTERVAELLTGAQADCAEMQWQSLLQQALECAGFSSSAVAAGIDPLTATRASVGGSQGGNGTAQAESLYLDAEDASARQIHFQFTKEYSRKCQRRYISSFFLLLRQLYARPELRHIVSGHMNLELALTFLFAPRLSPSILSSTLSLISSLITGVEEAQLVWQFLDQHGLLQRSTLGAMSGTVGASNAIGAASGFHYASAASVNAAENVAPHAGPQEQSLSLIGHCQFECRQGSYDITIGFLNLLIALFAHDYPAITSEAVYSTVVHFVSQEVMRGVTKRAFATEQQRHTVIALAATALREALQVRFHAEGGTKPLSFEVVMATQKAPADVLGEAIEIIFAACDSPHEIPSHHRVALRQCLLLITAAIRVASAEKRSLYSFDSRTIHYTKLAQHVLSLCVSGDLLLLHATLELLQMISVDTANQAAKYWQAEPQRYRTSAARLRQLLSPRYQEPYIQPPPPELQHIYVDCVEASEPGWADSVLSDTKCAALDLLIQHASVIEPSLTAWVCGFYAETTVRRAALEAARQCGATRPTPSSLAWVQGSTMSSILEGACSQDIEGYTPHIAVKYAKLLYLLRANRLYGEAVIREVLLTHAKTQFLSLLRFHPSHCVPVTLSKYAYVLKTLALEACYTHRTQPEQLSLTYTASMPPIAIEVLVALLNRAAGGSASEEAGTLHGEDRNSSEVSGGFESGMEATANIVQWLPAALGRLPSYPDNLPATYTTSDFLVPRAADGVVQYNIPGVYSAMMRERAAARAAPLTDSEMRELLLPYVRANQCFLDYASGANFVDGWCQLLSLSVSVVSGMSQSQLRSLVLAINGSLQQTFSMTAAAQEQLSIRLCACMSTIMTQLRHKAARERKETGAYASLHYDTVGGSTLERSRLSPSSRGQILDRMSVRPNGFVRDQSGSALSVHGSRRRPREESRSGLLAAAGSLVALPSRELEEGAAPLYHSPSNALLAPLVATVVRLGTRLPAIRPDLYSCLLCLSQMPGVSLDHSSLWRSQKKLLEVLCSDVCSNGPVDPVAQQHALGLLVALLQVSQTLRQAFCCPDESQNSGLGAMPTRCAMQLLQMVDSEAYDAVTKGGRNLGLLLWRIRSTFDFLCTISMEYSAQVVQQQILSTCFAMKTWQRGVQVVLGHTNGFAEAVGSSSNATIQYRTMQRENHEILQRLLLGAVRWFNVLLASLGGSATGLVESMQKFAQVNQQAIQFTLESPSSLPHVTELRLALYAELTDFLRSLSASFLAEECRYLVESLALPELLIDMTSDSMVSHSGAEKASARGGISYLGESRTELSGGPDIIDPFLHNGDEKRGSAGPDGHHHHGAFKLRSPHNRRKDSIALTARNIAHVLLHTEYGLRFMNPTHRAAEHNRTVSDAAMLRGTPEKRGMVLRALAQVNYIIKAGATPAATTGAPAGQEFGVDSGRAASSQGGAGARLDSFQAECHVLTLHALVLLVHSFVIPLASPSSVAGRNQGNAPSRRGEYLHWLSQLPLPYMLGLLEEAQAAMYEWSCLNADYRGALRGRRSSGAWEVQASQALSIAMQEGGTSVIGASRGPVNEGISGSKVLHRPSSGTADASLPPSTPSTPFMALRDGRNKLMTSQTVKHGAEPAARTAGEEHRSRNAPEETRGKPGSVQHALVPVAGHEALHGAPQASQSTTMVMESWDEGRSGGRHGQLPVGADPHRGWKEGASLWDALPHRDDNHLTQLYQGAASNGDQALVAVNGAADADWQDPDTWRAAAAAPWSEVLSIENEVRQVKIAIANAIRAVKSASEKLREEG